MNSELIDLRGRVDESREVYINQKKRVYDSIQTMLRELSELGSNYPIPEKVFFIALVSIICVILVHFRPY